MKFDDEICKGVSCPECSFNKGEDGCLLAKRLDEIEIIPEPCEDTISRQVAKEQMIKYGFHAPDMTVTEFVEDLPPVTPQKMGHWIQTNEFFINQDGQFIYKFICSECKSLSYFRKSNKKAIGANVCPSCGAKMVEPQERSDKE